MTQRPRASLPRDGSGPDGPRGRSARSRLGGLLGRGRGADRQAGPPGVGPSEPPSGDPSVAGPPVQLADPGPPVVDPERVALDEVELGSGAEQAHDWDSSDVDWDAPPAPDRDLYDGLPEDGDLEDGLLQDDGPEDGRRPARDLDLLEDAPLTALPDAPGAEVTGGPPAPNPTGAPPARTGRAGRDMVAAIGVGLGLGTIVLASLFVYRPAFVVVLAVAVVISLVELTRALQAGNYSPPLPPLLVGALAMVALAWWRGPTGLVVGFLLTVFAVLLWRLGDGPVGYLRDASTGVFVALYVPLLAGFAVLLTRPDDGVARVIAFIATVVASDVGGFQAGVLFGKHPMAPSVSPKKSWEGMAGSVGACALVGGVLVSTMLDGPWWGGALYGVAIAVSSTLGDLGESLIKRDLGIKDMGHLLPGHGGLMDRMDSLLPSAAVAYLLLTLVAPA